MKLRISAVHFKKLVMLLAVALPTLASAASLTNKLISTIRAPDDRPCTFFMLEGVAVADPATPPSPWIALRQTHDGYKENLALVTAAKLTGRPVNVFTSGTLVPACGHVEAVVVELP